MNFVNLRTNVTYKGATKVRWEGAMMVVRL